MGLTDKQKELWIEWFLYKAGCALKEGDTVTAGRYLRKVRALCSRV
jgi:hypothetical protein